MTEKSNLLLVIGSIIHVNAREEAPLAGVSEPMCRWLPIANWENDSHETLDV